MRKFNQGRPYHGSANISDGKLRGTTDTDYFYFFCPKCPDDEILRLLDYGIHYEESVNRYNDECKSKAERGFTVVFNVRCEKCGLDDFVKISNLSWQGGTFGARSLAGGSKGPLDRSRESGLPIRNL